MPTTTAQSADSGRLRRLAGLLLALLVGAVLVSGCGDDTANGTPTSPEKSETAMPSTVWDLIDRVTTDPPDTKGKAQQLVGSEPQPVTNYRFETEPVDLSSELRQVKLIIGLNEDGWTFTSFDFTLNECTTINEVKRRYPDLVDSGADPPSPKAERYYAENYERGTLTFGFSVASKCLAGIALEPPK